MYIQLKTLTLEDGEHEVVLNASDEIFLAYDIEVNAANADMIVKKDDKYIVREQSTWDGFPMYEFKNNEIIEFNYKQYGYFTDIDRRKALSGKIRKQYNLQAENKIMRKTLKKILDYLGLEDESFNKYNTKVEKIIKKIPKGGK